MLRRMTPWLLAVLLAFVAGVRAPWAGAMPSRARAGQALATRPRPERAIRLTTPNRDDQLAGSEAMPAEFSEETDGDEMALASSAAAGPYALKLRDRVLPRAASPSRPPLRTVVRLLC
jgi:hypothetical protein